MTSAGIIATPAAGAGAPITRQYFAGQALPMSQNADDSTWVNQLTLTFTPDSADYVIFWTCEVAHDEPTAPIGGEVQVRLTIDGSTLDTLAVQSLTDEGYWYLQGGMHFLTGAGASVTATIDFKLATLNLVSNCRCRNARIVALRLEGGDETAESLATQSDTLVTFSDAVTLSFTPATPGNYLILGFAALVGGLIDTTHSRLFDGTLGTPDVGWTFLSGGESPGFTHGWIKNGLSGAQTFKLQYRSNTALQTSGMTGARILALRLDGFTHGYNSHLSADSNGGGTSFGPALSLTRTVAAQDYLMIVAAFLEDGGSGTTVLEAQIDDPTAVINNPNAPPRTHLPMFSAAIGSIGAGRRAWQVEARGIGGPTPQAAVNEGAVIAALQLG